MAVASDDAKITGDARQPAHFTRIIDLRRR
jgi:hypothetical protein